MNDSEFAASLAERAGELLLDLRRTSALTGKELGKAGDAQANELLLELLAAGRPDDAVLSEESADSPARLSADRVWIIDPLDGTREYGMEGRTDWAVHVALWERGSEITAAAVAQPALSTVYTTGVSTSTTVERETPIFLMSASRPPAWGASVVEAFGAESTPMGSAGAKAMAVLRGDADAYLHDGGQWEWDSAAPVGVALAAGLHATRVDGSTLTYNAAHPYLPDLLICRADLADGILEAIAAAAD